MTTTSQMAAATGASGAVFVSPTAGVATLDPPHLSQTKSEIRTIVAEIAELAASSSSRDEFLYGMLPRICTAMGATAAAVWSIDTDQNLSLVGKYALPEALCESDSSAAIAHHRVLACVAAEGSPVMVPPGSTRVIADRPTNPLDEALLIVPVRIHERVDTLLEVVQPPGGGPAAQRGYLRFVAQMADLLADFLRRARLRELNQQAEYVSQLERHLQSVITADSPAERTHATARALARLLQSDMVLLMRGQGRRWTTSAVSELPTFDARSEIIKAAEFAMRQVASSAAIPDSHVGLPLVLSTRQSLEVSTDNEPACTRLRELLGCDRIVLMPLTTSGQWHAIIAVDDSTDMQEFTQRAPRLAHAFGGLLQSLSQPAYFLRALPWWNRNNRAQSAPHSTSSRIASPLLWRWLARVSIAGLAVTIASLPMPDQLRVVAVMEAVDRQLYYAPSGATIEKIHVDSHQTVHAGDVLLELVDRDLDARLDQLTSERAACATQLEQDRQALVRGQQLTPALRDELESRIEQWKIKMRALDEQLSVMGQQSDQLRVVARQDAIVATWDARNRLAGRPVAAGQLLLVTNAPDSRWRLQLSIPERMAGRIDELLKRSSEGLNVQFSSSGEPEAVESGRLTQVSKQLIKDAEGHAHVIGTVVLDKPLKTTPMDGAVARASIDCGQTFALWLVVRDAYREARSWLQMTF